MKIIVKTHNLPSCILGPVNVKPAIPTMAVATPHHVASGDLKEKIDNP